jgi:hypothetical protein
MEVASVLIQKSTKSIIKYASYPKAEITPITDIDPDYEWLIQNTPYTEPDYDPRIYLMVTNYPDLNLLNTFQEHPLYPGIKEYRITYSPEKRSKEDIIISIDNAQKEANDLIWSEGEHKDKQLLMMQASLKASTGATLNDYEESLLEAMNIIAVKLSKNEDNRNILVSMVNANVVPNIDEGWERS